MDELDQVRRDAVIRLCRAQARGQLSPEAFEERYALLRGASSRAAVAGIVADLEPARDEDGVAYPSDPVEVVAPPAPAIRVPAIFGSATRVGNWEVPEEISLLVIVGEAHLDFRDATFTSDTVVINVSLTLGSLKLTVPPGTQVENECHHIMSSAKHSRPRKDRRATEPNGLLIVVQGRLVLGELTIKEEAAVEKRSLLQKLGLE
jgi:hypothetical protein